MAGAGGSNHIGGKRRYNGFSPLGALRLGGALRDGKRDRQLRAEVAKCLEKFVGVLIAVGGLPRGGLLDDHLQFLGNGAAILGLRGGDVAVKVPRQNFVQVSVERRGAGDQFKQHDADRIDVGGLTDAAKGFGVDLFGRHVLRRAGAGLSGACDAERSAATCDAKIQQLGLEFAVGFLHHHDVFRLDVAVNDVQRMNCIQRRQRLQRDVDRFPKCNALFQRFKVVPQRLAGNVLHDQHDLIIDINAVVEGDDVGVGTDLRVEDAFTGDAVCQRGIAE